MEQEESRKVMLPLVSGLISYLHPGLSNRHMGINCPFGHIGIFDMKMLNFK